MIKSAAALLVLASLLAGPPSAMASGKPPGNYPGGADYRGSFNFVANGLASDGFKFKVAAYRFRGFDAQSNRSEAFISLLKIGHDSSRGGKKATYYRSRVEHLSAERVVFDLAHLGSVNLHFNERHEKTTRPARCRGTYTSRQGIVTGRIRFDAENGYTHISSPLRIHGHLDIDRRYNCYPEPPKKARPPKPRPALAACPDGGRFYFAAYDDAGPRPIFYAGLTNLERLAPGLRVARYAYVKGGRFDYAQDLTSATLMPPDPFHGSAAFSTSAHGEPGTLDGDMRLQLPGLDEVTPLTPYPAIFNRTYPPFDCPPTSARASRRPGDPPRSFLRRAGGKLPTPGLGPAPPDASLGRPAP